MHQRVDPRVLYFGTPVVLVSTINPDGTPNLAPMSSAWWLGRSCMLGLDCTSRTPENLLRTGECVLNLCDAGMVGAVDALALLTGTPRLPAHKREKGFRHELDKFGAAGLSPVDSDKVAAPRVVESPIQMEAVLVSSRSLGALDVEPVHVAGQDMAGGVLCRLATEHPGDVRSIIATEMGLAGFSLEGVGDVTHGGSLHIGALAAPGIARMLFTGREHELLGVWAFPSMTAVHGSVDDADVEEFSRVFSRDGGWNGAVGLYQSMLAEGEDSWARAAVLLSIPTLAVGGFGGSFTARTWAQVIEGPTEADEL